MGTPHLRFIKTVKPTTKYGYTSLSLSLEANQVARVTLSDGVDEWVTRYNEMGGSCDDCPAIEPRKAMSADVYDIVPGTQSTDIIP